MLCFFRSLRLRRRQFADSARKRSGKRGFGETPQFRSLAFACLGPPSRGVDGAAPRRRGAFNQQR